MFRLACFVGLVMSIQLMWGSVIRLNDAASYIKVGSINLTDIRLEINIASLHCSPDGKIRLPREFESFLSYSGQFPILTIPVLIDNAGEYRCEFTDHRMPTPFRYGLISDPDTQTATWSKAYRLRDLRGLDVYVTPFHTQDGNLLVSDHITIDLLSLTPDQRLSPASPRPKLNPYFFDIYRHHFINFDCRYEDIAEYGSMAVICPTGSDDIQLQQFRDLIQPWVEWKNQKGIPTTVYSTDVTGDSYAEIRDFIQNLYESDPQLTFVQLVGDYDQLPCQVATISGNTGGMDAFYSLLEGDDYYPDIFVGRFSAEIAAELYTQIQRSIEYEKGTTSGDWLSRAAGVCSNNPPLPGDDDEHNWEHLDKIRAQLLAYGYTQVDRIYANEGAGAQELINCLNSGQSLVNYCGEGYATHWVAPEFWNSDATNLSNTNMLPFIHVVSCWTGQFYNGTCLAEALMRSRDATSEQARGAIAVYAAAPEQGIAPPMEAQDHAMALLVSGTKNTIGGLCYNGSCSMIAAYGEGGVYNFLAWNLFGDASLVLRTQPATQIAAVLPDELPPHCAHLVIDTGCPDTLVALTHGARILASGFSGPDGYVHLDLSDSPVPGLSYLLTLTGFNRLPVQRHLACYGDGAHPVLDLTVIESGQFIEPETEIIKTVRITNRGQLPAENVSVSLVPDSQSSNLIPLQGVRNLGQILPGGQIQTTLSFRISKGTPDLTTLRYSFAVTPYGLLYECSDVIHSPTPVLESVRRDPQINWVNPGDAVNIVYSLRNAGSAVLRNPQGILSTDSAWLQISQYSTECPSLGPGCADTLVFHAQLTPGCPVHATLGIQLALDADNALGGCWQTWLVTDPQTTVESFESQDLQAFPWVYQSGQWDFGHNPQDGFNCLCSQAVAADSIWLELSFISLEAAELSYSYQINPGGGDSWSFRLNQSQLTELTDSGNAWNYRRFALDAGPNTIRWVGRRGSGRDVFASRFCLDVIEFPSQTLFDNALLRVDAEEVTLTLAPGEIRQIPLRLASPDGKYISYTAVIRKSDPDAAKNGAVWLSCNKSTFQPGTEELFFLTLHNASPDQSVRELRIDLPDGVLATMASHFNLPGHQPLPFSGTLGSPAGLCWSSNTGTDADSLYAGIRLLTDASLSALTLPCQIRTQDDAGNPLTYADTLELATSDSLGSCLSVLPQEGGLQNREEATLILTANQNLLGEVQDFYTLAVYYNGNHSLSIPIRIEFDPDPPGFYDIPHLCVYPNPFQLGTTFAYAVPADGLTELSIYNLRGQKVKTLVAQDLAQGYYRIHWDTLDDRGRALGSGIYFCRLAIPGRRVAAISCVLFK